MKKILGVGTALVDVICQVQDNVINDLKLTKGSMTLIEESQIQEIRSNFANPLITSGGSVCNTVHELNYSSHEASFYGKVNELPTCCCNILVSPDGERTMATHIGIG